jgi:glutamate carboxypeptidase
MIEIRDWLESRKEDFLLHLHKMVEINSYTFNPHGVNELAEYTCALFGGLGFTEDKIPSKNPDTGSHLILSRLGKTSKTVVLISHLDTVYPPEEEKRHNFIWREVDDRVYGPGTIDIKGGTLMAHLVLQALQYFKPELFCNYSWMVLFNASEESGMDDLGERMHTIIPIEDVLAALVFEGGFHKEGVFRLPTSRNGVRNGTIIVKGKAGHAGASHHRSANAIVELGALISPVAAVTDYEQGITLNVGFISGGKQTNCVPDEAILRFELRAPTSELLYNASQHLEKIVANTNKLHEHKGSPCQAVLSIEKEVPPPWPKNPGTERLFSYWIDAAKDLGYTVTPEHRGSVSDANNIGRYCPTLDGLGPGGTNAHCAEVDAATNKDQEYLLVSSIVPKALLNFIAVRRLLEANL